MLEMRVFDAKCIQTLVFHETRVPCFSDAFVGVQVTIA